MSRKLFELKPVARLQAEMTRLIADEDGMSTAEYAIGMM